MIVAAVLGGLLMAGQASAAERTAQQQKMTDCNNQASTQSLKGEARKGFMSTCLKKDHKAPKALTAQQQKMKTCNADAKQKALKGADRKSFMSSCLKKG
nr:PsiF family protein [Tatumella sp. JGM118]